MCSLENPKILYRNPRLLRLAFLQLHHQQRSGIFCDVLLQAEGEAVPAHCCILSACSPFFTERLQREWPAQGQKVVLELGGLKIATLRKLVDFLYTSEMEVSREEAQDVLLAARQLRVSELESLQLEGGKLVRAAQGRRLNRECLQPPAGAPISARVVGPSPPPRTPQPPPQAAPAPGAGKPKLLGKEEGPREKSRVQAAEPGAAAAGPLVKAKARICPPPQAQSASPKSQAPGPKENRPPGPVAAELLPASPPVDEPLLPRKIRLSRPRLSPDVCPARPLGALPSAAPAGRRLWRQKTFNKEAAEEERGPGRAGLAAGVRSPPLPPQKRSPEARAPGPDAAEEGQVGRVKLRKIVNGSCWEVVQECPSRAALGGQRAAGPGCGQDTRAAADTDAAPGPPAAPAPPEPQPPAGEGSGPAPGPGPGGPYEPLPPLLGAPREPEESEEYRLSGAAAASELEEILDFMLCGSDMGPAAGSLGSTPSYGLPGTDKSWAEADEWCLPDLQLWPADKDPGLSPLAAPRAAGPPAWASGPGAGSPPPGGRGDTLLCPPSPGCFHAPYGGLSPPCPAWGDPGYEKPPVLADAPSPEPDGSEQPGPSPRSPEEEGDIDVGDWAAQVERAPWRGPSVRPDPSSESETEVDVLT